MQLMEVSHRTRPQVDELALDRPKRRGSLVRVDGIRQHSDAVNLNQKVEWLIIDVDAAHQAGPLSLQRLFHQARCRTGQALPTELCKVDQSFSWAVDCRSGGRQGAAAGLCCAGGNPLA